MKKRKQPEEIKTLLGKGTCFEGELTFEGTVRIDGAFKGKIASAEATLVVGTSGCVEGEVSVAALIVQGCVHGVATISGLSRLLAGSSFRGTLQTKELVVEQGGVLHGEVRMEGPVLGEGDKERD